MYTYMLCLNDFGIRPQAIWKMTQIKAAIPNPEDVYNPNLTNYGHSNLDGEKVPLGWDLTKHSKIDIRLFYS